MKILIADETRANRYFMTQALIADGYEVITVNNGLQLMDRFKERSRPGNNRCKDVDHVQFRGDCRDPQGREHWLHPGDFHLSRISRYRFEIQEPGGQRIRPPSSTHRPGGAAFQGQGESANQDTHR